MQHSSGIVKNRKRLCIYFRLIYFDLDLDRQ